MTTATYMSRKESVIYEWVCAGMKPLEIANRMKLMPSSLYTVLQRLLDLHILEKHGDEYRGKITGYEIIESANKLANMRRRLSSSDVILVPFDWLELTDKEIQYIVDHHKKPRRSLAAALGLPRYVINREIMRLGIEKTK